MIDSNKDRQEAAVYAFTIVTIVFLPLSFVSGFLGMNTADLRDMPHRQWVFWAAALPLTLVIILLGLLWAGELGNAWRWCLGFLVLDGRRGGRQPAYGKSGMDGMEEVEMGGEGLSRRRTGGLVRRGTAGGRG